ncbi:hypothetical protein PTTG_26199 [Puccinia triticina 1-1 BBBD Race 1]|uniref:Cyanovirin-N domain-containing protein n=1 Tax=Puccinia triticina (isolate 1-1 / race 1 (BBBD)) TaxID=630390 RepID=A0A180GVV4_PUCT1|nr:hypothetical protein PTTG_26199 [Puccinia triticina 1-1 BBBD Race 1]
MFKNSLFSSLMVALISLSLTVLSATVEKSPSAKHQVECTRRWSTVDSFKNQYLVACDDENSNTCDARTCHMGGSTGTADSNRVSMELFFDQCAKIDRDGKELTGPDYRIFPRAYEVSRRNKSIIGRSWASSARYIIGLTSSLTCVNLLAFGFAQSEPIEKDTFFKCAWNQASALNLRRSSQ